MTESDRKLYKQQIGELNNKLEDLTQAFEMLNTPNSYMTQKSIKLYIKEIYSKGPKRNYITNKKDVYHIDQIWSLDI